jgi:hypothetical protein
MSGTLVNVEQKRGRTRPSRRRKQSRNDPNREAIVEKSFRADGLYNIHMEQKASPLPTYLANGRRCIVMLLLSRRAVWVWTGSARRPRPRLVHRPKAPPTLCTIGLR